MRGRRLYVGSHLYSGRSGGTFGLRRGTALARELEMLYSMESGPHPAFAQRLVDNAGELNLLITFRR